MKTKTSLTINPINTSSPHCRTVARLLVALALALTWLTLAPTAHAQLPSPTPDGGYPGNNTAEGEDALFDLDVNSSTDNTAVGFDAMSLTTVTSGNTAVGSQ